MSTNVIATSIEDELRASGYLLYPVTGISMLPLLHDSRDLVKVVPLFEAPVLFDVVLYRRPAGGYVLHRVVGIRKKGYITSGDNQRTTEFVPASRVIGKAVGFMKDGNFLSVTDDDYLSYVKERCENITVRDIFSGNEQILPEWLYILSLIRSMLSDKEFLPVPADVCLDRLLKILKNQSLTATLVPYIDKSALPSEFIAKANEASARNLQKEILFQAEFDKISRKLSDACIWHAPLKGYYTRKLYGKIDSREFSDFGILFDASRATDVKSIMESEGYTAELFGKYVHDTYQKNSLYYFEFHRSLLSPGHPLAPYFSDIQKRLLPTKIPYLQEFSDTDLCLHALAHFYYHDTTGGAGLRMYLDLWLIYQNRFACADFDKTDESIKKVLLQYGLSDYGNRLLHFITKLFTADVRKLSYWELSRVFGNGTYGSTERRVGNGVKENGSFHYLLLRIFPSVSALAIPYPILNKVPLLLPFIWVYRGFQILFSRERREHVKNEMHFLHHSENRK